MSAGGLPRWRGRQLAEVIERSVRLYHEERLVEAERLVRQVAAACAEQGLLSFVCVQGQLACATAEQRPGDIERWTRKLEGHFLPSPPSAELVTWAGEKLRGAGGGEEGAPPEPVRARA